MLTTLGRTSVTLLAFSTAVAVAGEPSLTAKQVGPDHFELLLVTDRTADVGVAQRAIWPAAQQLCKGKMPKYGHYKFESANPLPGQASGPPGITLRQEVHCETPQAPRSLPPAAPVPHDDALIERLTLQYLAARDKGAYPEAYAMFGDSMKASTTFDSWSTRARTTNDTLGKAGARKVKKITWYDNPPSAPTPGIYAAADYESRFDNAHFHCGYVVWLAGADGTFRIVREEENFVEKKAAAKMKPDQVAAFAQRHGCESP